MSVFVEFHILQNVAPSLLNRDDTGGHKDALFGGVRRARISSQCMKRAMREHWKRADQLPDDARALRTKRILAELQARLVAAGRNSDAAAAKAQAALAGLKFSIVDEGKSQYLLFLGADEIQAMAAAIDAHWDLIGDTTAAGGEAKSKVKKKAEAKDACPAEVVKAMEHALAQTRSLEVHLFGRMLADRPDNSVDACCQVAHALGTSALEREFDYYTAVDDLQPADNSGADMIGQVEFASSCFYRYAVVDLSALHRQLGGNTEVTARGLQLFAEAMIHALPSGKQNTFAAHQLPCHVAITVRSDGLPRALTNAFERPVRVRGKYSLSGESALALEKHRTTLDRSYGATGRHWFHDLSDAEIAGGESDVAAVVAAALPAALAALAG